MCDCGKHQPDDEQPRPDDVDVRTLIGMMHVCARTTGVAARLAIVKYAAVRFGYLDPDPAEHQGQHHLH